MKFPQPVSVNWVAALINAKVTGDGEKEALGINEIHKVEQGDLCFVDHPKYYDACLNSSATHIIINTTEVIVPDGKTLLVTADPFEAYLTIVDHFRPFTAATKPERYRRNRRRNDRYAQCVYRQGCKNRKQLHHSPERIYYGLQRNR